MKKLLTALTGLILISYGFASVPSNPHGSNPRLNASSIIIPIGKTGCKISLLELSTISRAELELKTGRQMGFTERLSFHSTQRKLRKGIDDNGNLTNRRMMKMFSGDGQTGFHVGGFALGFLVGIVGVLIAYLINDDKKRNRVKWAWIGFGVYLLVVLAILAAYASGVQ